jgi:hypothetical protein
MERTSPRKLNPLIRASVIVLIILCAIYIPFRLHQARSGSGAEQPPPDTALSIFVTDELAGYREPSG